MSEGLPPMDAHLRELVTREREIEEPLAPARAEAMLSAVQGAAAGAAAAGTAAATKAAITLSAAKLTGIVATALLAGAAIGAGAHIALTPARPAPASSPVPASPPVPVPVPVPVPEPSGSALAPAPSPASPRPTSRPLVSDLPQEQTIIDAARAGLSSGRYDVVLDAVSRHERLFSRGQLAEERDALRILALARSGRAAEASQRLTRFRVAYPSSALLPKLESAVPPSSP